MGQEIFLWSFQDLNHTELPCGVRTWEILMALGGWAMLSVDSQHDPPNEISLVITNALVAALLLDITSK